MLKFDELVQQVAPQVRCISARDAARELKGQGALVIDVRESAEVSSRPNHRATHIPRGVIELHIGKHCDDPDQAIYLHCAAGGRATLAAEQLQRMGYRSVTAIVGKLDEVLELLD
ncbi:MAG: rhodanese-like domain-containing protein [Planctomycetota bacterium]